jgi:hypothetical protein
MEQPPPRALADKPIRGDVFLLFQVGICKQAFTVTSGKISISIARL